MFTHLVNAETNVIMVEQDSGAPVVLPKHTRLDSNVDIKINGFFATPESSAKLALLGRNRGSYWNLLQHCVSRLALCCSLLRQKHLILKGLLAANAL